MPHPGSLPARGHLRLAGAPARSRPESRLLLAVRGAAAALAVAWLTVIAWCSATMALLPLAWRRAPLGRRLRPAAPRVARVIPFHPRRQPRQALPR